MILNEYEKAYYLMASACKTAKEKFNLTNAYLQIDNAIKADNDYGLVEVYESIMSAPDYKAIRELIHFPKETIVVDCGCNVGLQQVFFNDCYKYIGIDIHNTFIKISRNAKFIHGDLIDILPNLEFPANKHVVGISVLCGAVWPEIGDKMKEKFNKIIMI